MTIYGLIKTTKILIPTICLVGFVSCHQQSTSGSQTRLQVAVGQIKEVTLPISSDSTHKVVATSDNSEIVDVSLKKSADTATGTVQPSTNTFLIKGVTMGTARVIFTENQIGISGPGPIRKAYFVRVVAE